MATLGFACAHPNLQQLAEIASEPMIRRTSRVLLDTDAPALVLRASTPIKWKPCSTTK